MHFWASATKAPGSKAGGKGPKAGKSRVGSQHKCLPHQEAAQVHPSSASTWLGESYFPGPSVSSAVKWGESLLPLDAKKISQVPTGWREDRPTTCHQGTSKCCRKGAVAGFLPASPTCAIPRPLVRLGSVPATLRLIPSCSDTDVSGWRMPREPSQAQKTCSV